MAGSGWNHLVKYDGNTASLMHAIETHVFAAGEYQTPVLDEPDFLDEIELFTVSKHEREEIAEQYGLHPVLSVAERIGYSNFIRWALESSRLGNVASLEELRALQCLSSSGTHSALDLQGLADSPTDFKVAPLGEADRIAVFGTSTVQLEQVRSMRMFVASSIPNAYRNWQAVFVPVLSGSEVTHAYVEGASGD